MQGVVEGQWSYAGGLAALLALKLLLKIYSIMKICGKHILDITKKDVYSTYTLYSIYTERLEQKNKVRPMLLLRSCKMTKIYSDRPLRSRFPKRADYDKAVQEYEDAHPETDEEAILAEEKRRYRVRQLSMKRVPPTKH
jgi:hypothetical protein